MRRYLAELVGTFVLVVGGVGSAVLAGDRIGYAGIALAFGLCLTALIYAIGPISGCHVNPAVTLGMVAARRLPARDAFGYVAGQVVGAILGAACILAIAKGSMEGYDAYSSGLGANGFGAHSPGQYNFYSALMAEVVLTFILVFTVLATTSAKARSEFAGLAIGGALVLIHLVGIPVDGTSVNPARSLGPALLAGGWALQQLWVFILGPVLGAYFAAALYDLFEASEEPAADAADATAS